MCNQMIGFFFTEYIVGASASGYVSVCVCVFLLMIKFVCLRSSEVSGRSEPGPGEVALFYGAPHLIGSLCAVAKNCQHAPQSSISNIKNKQTLTPQD